MGTLAIIYRPDQLTQGQVLTRTFTVSDGDMSAVLSWVSEVPGNAAATTIQTRFVALTESIMRFIAQNVGNRQRQKVAEAAVAAMGDTVKFTPIGDSEVEPPPPSNAH